jgi:hypothetical protein
MMINCRLANRPGCARWQGGNELIRQMESIERGDLRSGHEFTGRSLHHAALAARTARGVL